MDMASPYQTEAASLMRNAAGNIQGGVGAAQQGMADAVNYGQGITGTAIGGLDQAAAGARAAALRGQTASNAAGALIPGVMNTAQLGNNAALAQAQGAINAAGQTGVGTTLSESLAASSNAARNAALTGQTGLDAAAQGALSGRTIAGAAGAGTSGAINAARNAASLGSGALAQAGLSGAGIAADAGLGARNLTNEAARSLQAAGALGLQSAQQGIAGLANTTGAYNPASANSYMNQYEDTAVQQALADIRRAGDIQQQSAAAQAVGAGAFGGSRQAIAESELGRNVLDRQAQAASGLRRAGFDTALKASQTGAQLMGGLGQALGNLAGTTADIGRVGSELGRADLGMLTELGGMGRNYQSQLLEAQRQNKLQTAQEPYTRMQLGQQLLKGIPSGDLSSTFTSTTTPSTNPFLAGIGAYTALQGIKPSGSA